MFSESGEPIAPDGSVPVWRFGDRVVSHATWLPEDLRGQTGKVWAREWQTGGYWVYRVRYPGGEFKHIVEAQLACARHNDRGGTETAGRDLRTYCTCGHLVGTEPR